MRLLSLVLSGAFVAASASFSPAFAQKARVLLLVEETHDGSRANAGGGEAKLAEGLLGGGYQLVERYEAEAARSRISLDRMLHGDTNGLEVTGLSADVLVVARLSVSTEAAPYGISYPVHAARIDVRALAVDTGRVFYANSVETKAPGDFGAAAAKAARSVLEPLLAALATQGSAREVLEVRVSGLRDARAADQLAAQLGRIPGVKWAKVRYVSGDATMIDVAAPGLDPQRLEAALKASHLVVARRSANVLEASYDEAAAARRTVAIASFVNRTGRPELSWVGGMLPDVFETELINSRYLEPVAGRPAVDPDQLDLGKLRGVRAEVLVVGKVERTGPSGIRLTVKALRPSDGAILAAAQLFGSESAVAELGKELVYKLDPALYQKLSGQSSLASYVSPRRAPLPAERDGHAQAPGDGGPLVRVEEVKLGDLFPSRIGAYAERPLGRVVLRNQGRRAAEDVRVEISLGELSGGAQTLRAGSIAPGESKEVPLRLVLDRRALLEVSQRRPARADLAVLVGGERQAFTEPLVLWDRNALDWNEPDSVAAFVTPRDPVVKAFADEAARLAAALPPSVPQPVRLAAALFDAVVGLGTRYARDPLSPYGDHALDTVQFPRETLARMQGDCDDLSVLFASLAQAEGLDARLVLTPGHIFVAVDSELPSDRAQRLGGPSKILDVNGRAFLPIEITQLDGGFAAAWAAGLREIGRYGDATGKVSFVDVPRAWQRFPAFPLDAPGGPPAVPEQRARALLTADARAFGAASPAGEVAAAPPEPSASPEARLAWAIARGQSGDLPTAERALVELASGPATPPATRAKAANNLGNVATLLSRYDEAARAYERALGSGGDARTIEQNLGLALFLGGHGADARRHLERAGTPQARKLMAELKLATRAAPRPRPVAPPGHAATPEPVSLEEGARAAQARVDPIDYLIWLK